MEYTTLYLFRTQLEKTTIKDTRIKPIFMDLYRITALHYLTNDSGALFQSEFFAPIANKHMKVALDKLIEKIRPQLIPLVEATSLGEGVVVSNIGNYYGDIYE